VSTSSESSKHESMKYESTKHSASPQLQVVGGTAAPHCGGGERFQQVSDYIAAVGVTLAQMPCGEVDRLVEALLRACEGGHAIFVFGNGGSAALASHAACDLGKGTCDVARERVRVLSLTDNVPLITAWANDTAYEMVFTEQMKNFIQPGDVAFAISGSGNSPNVLHALRHAREIGAVTVGLTGFEGGKMKPLCNVCVVVPSDNMQIIEDLHVMASHGIFTILRSRLRQPESRQAETTAQAAQSAEVTAQEELPFERRTAV
jgi:D-sedoheptulose 7-phosphate isomerase